MYTYSFCTTPYMVFSNLQFRICCTINAIACPTSSHIHTQKKLLEMLTLYNYNLANFDKEKVFIIEVTDMKVKMGYEIQLEGNTSKSDEALSDDVISLVTSSSERLVMRLLHCVYLSCWQ